MQRLTERFAVTRVGHDAVDPVEDDRSRPAPVSGDTTTGTPTVSASTTNPPDQIPERRQDEQVTGLQGALELLVAHHAREHHGVLTWSCRASSARAGASGPSPRIQSRHGPNFRS
jgi:hypothetical protein